MIEFERGGVVVLIDRDAQIAKQVDHLTEELDHSDFKILDSLFDEQVIALTIAKDLLKNVKVKIV